jgi:hypothetical protein
MKCLAFFFLFLLSQKNYSQTIAKDSTAIVKLLEKESSTWRSGDAIAHASCWKIRPYSIILVSTLDGKAFSLSPEMIAKPSPNMGKGGSSKNSNYKMSIHGNTAWVSHDEESISPVGEKSYSHEIRLLEKIHGEWKLVGQSIHMYNPGK